MCVDIHTHQQKSNSILNIYPTEYIPNQFFSIGIHPWYLDNLEIQKELLVEKSKHKNCLAIGECGFDRLCKTDLNTQEQIFDFQIDLAQKRNKPLIVHCVKAFDLLIPKIAKVALPIIIHGFNQNQEILRQLKQIENTYFSFGHSLLKHDSNAQKAMKSLSVSKILLETDNNQKIVIKDVYVKASELLNLSFIELEKNINNNYQSIFR